MLILVLVSCGGNVNNQTTTNNDVEHVHVEVIDPYVEPTCQTTGLTEGKHCSKCGNIIVPQEVIDTVECYFVWKIVKNATKTENGERLYECAYSCGNIIETETIYAGSQNLAYGENADGTYYVKSIINSDDRDIVIPEKYHGKDITGIGSGAMKGATSLTISSNIVYIDKDAFVNASSLKNITVASDNPDFSSLDGVLYSKDGKTLIKYPAGKKDTMFAIPDGVEIIEVEAFKVCRNLVEVIIPEGVVSIGSRAFENCSNLIKIELPETLQSLENGVFYQCYGLKEVTFSSDYTEIGTSVFKDCRELSNVVLPSNLTSIPDYMFWECISLESIEIPSSVTSIGTQSFNLCSELKNIVLPEGLITIGAAAFAYCGDLERINIPKTVEKVGVLMFKDCRSMQSIDVDPENKYFETIDGSLYIKSSNTLLHYAVGKSEKSFTIPEGIIDIYSYAFYNAKSLENVIIPDYVTFMGAGVFEYATSLKTVVVGNGITHIYQDTFAFCQSLSEITIMNNEVIIDSNAFDFCSNLEVINFNGTIDDWTAAISNSFLGNYIKDFTVYCTDGTITQSGVITYYEK